MKIPFAYRLAAVALALAPVFATAATGKKVVSPYWRIFVTVTGDEHFGGSAGVTSTVSNQFGSETSSGSGWIGPILSSWISISTTGAGTFPIFKSSVGSNSGPASTSGIFWSGNNDPIAPYGTSLDITVQWVGPNPPATASVRLDGIAQVQKASIQDVSGFSTIAYTIFTMTDYVTNVTYPMQYLQSPSLSAALFSDSKLATGSTTAPLTNGYGHYHVKLQTQNQLSIPSLNNVGIVWSVKSSSTMNLTILP